MTWLSAEQIRNTPATELGTGGFCCIAAYLLRMLYPNAQLYRLTEAGKHEYKHVYVTVAGQALDIKGFRSVSEMRSDFAQFTLIEEAVDADSMLRYICHRYKPDRLAAAMRVLSSYIDAHNSEFCRIRSVG
jgi:hypothetical protein